jgi:hypothetical protein
MAGSPNMWCSAVLLLGMMLACSWCTCSLAQQQNIDDLACSHYLDSYLHTHHREAEPYTDQDSQMVYFLHVPRTAGRTFHACFLKMGTPPRRRCPKAYDHLRLNMSVPDCYLLSSHDDFSVVSMLPGGEITSHALCVAGPSLRLMQLGRVGQAVWQSGQGPCLLSKGGHFPHTLPIGI